MQINLDGVQGVVLGGLAAIAMPLVLAYAKKRVPEMVTRWIGREVRLALAGAGVPDPDLRELMRDVILAAVRFAEKKLPDEGMGEARLRLVLDLFGRLPIVGSFVKGHEPFVRELVEEAVKRMDAEAKGILAAPPAP